MELKGLRKLKRDNKGLSLVELLISVAILAIVGIAITAFMTSGSQSYAKTSAEVDLQYDAQLAMTQLQDYLIDATECISYIEDPSGLLKTLTIITRDNAAGTTDIIAHIITWTGADGTDKANTLYYQQKNVTKTETVGLKPTYALGTDRCENSLMSEYIIDFAIDYSMLTQKNIINVAVKYKKGSREYDTNHNITVRNDLAINNIITSTTTPGPGGGLNGVVTGVRVTPKSVIASRGTTHNFRAIVLGTGPISQSVTWDYDATGAYTKAEVGSYISVDSASGKLQIKAPVAGELIPECLQDFVIIATCVDNPATTADESAFSDVAHVYVKEITDVSISGPTECEQNKEATFVASVAGSNLAAADQSVRWTVTSGASYVTQTGDGKFKVSATAPVGYTFSVKATSTVDPSKSSTPWTVKIKAGSKEPTDPVLPPEITIAGKNTLNRGETGVYTANITNMRAGYELKWEVKFVGKESKTGHEREYTENSVYTLSKSDKTLKISVLPTFDYDSTAVITVNAYMVKTGESKPAAEPESLSISVPPVTFSFSDAKKTVYYAKVDTEEYVDYVLTGITDGKLEWNVSDTSLLRISVNSSKKRIMLSSAGKTANGVATIKPKLGSKELDATVSVTVAPGNIYFKTYMGTEYFAYIPAPYEDGFIGDPAKARFTYPGWEGVWWQTLPPQEERNPLLETGKIYYGVCNRDGRDVWYLLFTDEKRNDGGRCALLKWNDSAKRWDIVSVN